MSRNYRVSIRSGSAWEFQKNFQLLTDDELNAIANEVRTLGPEKSSRHLFPLIQYAHLLMEFLMENAEELTLNSKVGAMVQWKTLDGVTHVGRLKEWDNGTAIVVMPDGAEKAVRCA